MNYKVELIRTTNDLISELEIQIILCGMVNFFITKFLSKTDYPEFNEMILKIETKIENLKNKTFTTIEEDK